MSHTRYHIEAAGEPRKFPPEAMARIEKILTRYPTKQAALLPVLWVAQETWGWISKESSEEVARLLGLPASHVDGVLTFYTMFNLRPVGKNLLQVCTSISCHLLGAEALVEHCGRKLGIGLEETTQGRQVHAGRGRVHRRLRQGPLDDGQRQVLRADGREEAGPAPRPARPGVLSMDKVLSRRVGVPNSQSIDTYVADGGYAGLRKVLTEGWTPEKVTEEVKKANVRGRGGAGFPAGVKWGFLPKDTKGKPVYLLCNADESEPGTFKDRLLMENDPHQLIEGMILASYAIRCRNAYIYIRGEFYDGARILNRAVEEAYAKGFLGENILGSGFSLDITVHRGAGAYICGEETGLIESLEGKRGQPRIKPPFPAVSGVFAAPDDRQQRRDALLRQARHRPRRRLVPEARPQREEHGAQALLHLGPRQPPRRLRGRDGPAASRTSSTARPTRRASRAARSSRPSSRAAPRRRSSSRTRSRTARSTSTASPPRARCSARPRSS